MEDFGHHILSNAQHKYGVNPSQAGQGISQSHHTGPTSPLSFKTATVGSANQRTAWRRPSGLSHSAATSKSTLFDETSSPVARISREG